MTEQFELIPEYVQQINPHHPDAQAAQTCMESYMKYGVSVVDIAKRFPDTPEFPIFLGPKPGIESSFKSAQSLGPK